MVRSSSSSSSRSRGSSSSDDRGPSRHEIIDQALKDLGGHRETIQNNLRESTAKKRATKAAENEHLLTTKLLVQEETTSRPLKQAISLLGLFNVFYLLNVDSFTRDDLMSMVAVKVCANVVRPGLVLDNVSLQVLTKFLEGLHVCPPVINKMQDLSEHIVRSKRSGEWLLTNLEYNKYLAGDHRKEAEPLSEVVKLVTIKRMTAFKVEAALQSLALLLVPEHSVKEYSSELFLHEGTRRQAFLQGLLELTNACMRATLAENLESLFEDLVRNPLANLGGTAHPKEIFELKHRQDRALLKLQQAHRSLVDKKTAPFSDVEFEESSYAQRKISQAFRSLLFDRLRILCIFQLQLVNVSAYNETGRAIKLAAWLADPRRTEKHVPLYWLIFFHAALASLGYDMHVVQALLDMWVPPSESQVPNLLVRGGAQVAEARKTFHRMRALLKHVGKRPSTKAYIDLFDGQEDVFLRTAFEFFEHFPESMQPERSPEALESACHALPETLSHFEGISRAIMEGHHHGRHANTEEKKLKLLMQIQAVVCEVTHWFELEEGWHFLRDATLKKTPPDLPPLPVEPAASKKKLSPKKNASPKLTSETEKILKSMRALAPASAEVLT